MNATTILTLIVCHCFVSQNKLQITEYESTLQRIASGDGESCLSVRVECKITVLNSFDFSRYKFENVRLYVENRKNGYRNSQVELMVNSQGFTTPMLSTVAPIWEAGLIPNKMSSVLPTARLVRNKNVTYLVFSDGKNHGLYRQDLGANQFVKCDGVTRDEAKMLREMYSRSFDPADVYWDYFMVTNASFFGYECDSDFQDKAIDTAMLHKKWKASKTRVERTGR